MPITKDSIPSKYFRIELYDQETNMLQEVVIVAISFKKREVYGWNWDDYRWEKIKENILEQVELYMGRKIAKTKILGENRN